MTARVAAGVLVTALIRRANEAGGSGVVLARGDAGSGAILLVLAERGVTQGLVERTLDADGRYRWAPTGPASIDEPGALQTYIDRRRRADPDLWAVELDAPDALGIAARLLG